MSMPVSPYPEDHEPLQLTLEEMDVPYDPKVGDWVRVWAQIKKTSDMSGVHPEDTLVNFFSHSEQYDADVRNDHIVFGPEKPEWARQCNSLFEIETKVCILGTKAKTTAYVRCELHEGHTSVHRRMLNDRGGCYQWLLDGDLFIEDSR